MNQIKGTVSQFSQSLLIPTTLSALVMSHTFKVKYVTKANVILPIPVSMVVNAFLLVIILLIKLIRPSVIVDRDILEKPVKYQHVVPIHVPMEENAYSRGVVLNVLVPMDILVIYVNTIRVKLKSSFQMAQLQ